MFLTYLKENGFLCHGQEKEFVIEDRKIFCKICKRLILDVDKHLSIDTQPMLSCYLAKLYAHWTGDLQVPCRIVIQNIPGIQPCFVPISYLNLIYAIELLGTVNQDFILCKNHQFDMKSTLKAKIMENFIDNYMKMIDEIQCEKEEIEKILKTFLRQLKECLSTTDYNIFDYYFKVICPYVKTFDDTIKEESLTVSSPGEFFEHLSKNATEIRNHFATYCLPFDIMYIMIYCFACHKNLDVVANFVFDLIARICNNYFDTVTHYQQICKNVLHAHINPVKNNTLYFLVKQIREGKAADLLSMAFYNNFAALQQLVFTEFCKSVTTPSETIKKFAFAQSFPFILFPEASNYYGFVGMMGFATSRLSIKHAQFEKGALASARKIMHFIENYYRKIRNFGNGRPTAVSKIKELLRSGEACNEEDRELQQHISIEYLQTQLNGENIFDLPDSHTLLVSHPVEFWTLEMFQVFIGTDDNLLKNLTNFLELLVGV